MEPVELGVGQQCPGVALDVSGIVGALGPEQVNTQPLRRGRGEGATMRVRLAVGRLADALTRFPVNDVAMQPPMLEGQFIEGVCELLALVGNLARSSSRQQE